MIRIVMRLAMLQIDYTYNAAATKDRHRKKCFKCVFGKFMKHSKSRIGPCIVTDCNGLATFRNPARDALATERLSLFIKFG